MSASLENGAKSMNDLFDPVNGHLSEPKSARFENFWSQVPKKVGRHQAEKTFKKLSGQAQVLATDAVKPFYEWWRKENPQATWLHPSTYLNQRRWEDEEWQEASKPKPQVDPLEIAERNIKSGKRFLCTNIGTRVVSELLRTNRVTKEQIKEVGL